MQDQNKETSMLLFKLDFKKLTTKNHGKLWNDSCIKKHPDLEQKSKSQKHPTFPLNTVNYFHKKLHDRSLTRSWIRLYY